MKRKAQSGGNRNKKYKVSGFIDPNTTGVWATCNRGRELGCRKELLSLLADQIEELYPDWEAQVEDKADEAEQSEEPAKQKLSVEDEIKQELAEMKSQKSKVHPLLHPIDLGCECLVFIKMKKPAEPAALVQALCQDAAATKQKKSRFIQKLSPVTDSVSASVEELEKLCDKVLAPHFHGDADPTKFAIQVTRRNFNSLEKDDIIKRVARAVGPRHTVDLKNYDKLVMVECYKNNIGMSVVSEYQKLEKYNLEQIFEKDMGESTLSRVKPDGDAKKQL